MQRNDDQVVFLCRCLRASAPLRLHLNEEPEVRIHDPAIDEEPYNLVPLTDMVFNLLIFFMCATTFAQIEKELSVQLPHTTSSFRPLSAPPRQFIINVRENGDAVVAGRTYDQSGLAELVASAVKQDPATSVIV